MRKGQFGNVMVDIIIWLIVLAVVAYLVYHFVVGGAGWIPGAGSI
jgi:hypothetical protein